MSSAYILCRVFPGLFDTEYYVTVNGSSAYYISRFSVEVKSEPNDNGVDGRVKGYVVEKSGGKTLVQLPGEPVVGGVRTWVENDAVATA
ncbi:MAG TPA: hypothetical protein VFX12_09395 [Vicinamibacterales bacterium]|nr:hypothetical protein [Vicinamibacterales bacterium]